MTSLPEIGLRRPTTSLAKGVGIANEKSVRSLREHREVGGIRAGRYLDRQLGGQVEARGHGFGPFLCQVAGLAGRLLDHVAALARRADLDAVAKRASRGVQPNPALRARGNELLPITTPGKDFRAFGWLVEQGTAFFAVPKTQAAVRRS